MKRKLWISSILSMVMIMIFAVQALAATEVSSKNFNLSGKDFQFHGMKYLVVESNGSVTVGFNHMNSDSWEIGVMLQNEETFNTTDLIILNKNRSSYTFKNVKAGKEYLIRMENRNNSSISGNLAYSWSGKWGSWIE
ncbi:hypothetical protein EEL31_21520 [Brevibacillus laterosporus]|nr:hypothetical protein [Brevibacillus laterosporus]TPG70767.1 hypothetical protein EEL31_21520 [Brevibacillus laterosporus]